MAQIPQQQIQVLQPGRPSTFQQTFLPQSQYLTIQPTPYRTPGLQNIAPAQAVNLHLQPKSSLAWKTLGQNAQQSAVVLQSQSYAHLSNGMQQRQIPVHSQIISAHDPSGMSGHGQILGPYTLSSLQSGYSWISPGQYQSPMAYRNNQQPNIYVQSPTPTSIQLPVCSVPQDMTPTSYMVCQETQTIATQTCIPNIGNCDSNVAFLPAQMELNNEMCVEPPVCSTTVSTPKMPASQSVEPTPIVKTETVDTYCEFNLNHPETESSLQIESNTTECESSLTPIETSTEVIEQFPLEKPKEENIAEMKMDTSTIIPSLSEVTSTTTVVLETPQNVISNNSNNKRKQDIPEIYSYAIVPSSPVPQLDDLSDYEVISSKSASEAENMSSGHSSQHFNPVIKLKRLKPQEILGNLKDKQRAIVKPQVVPLTNDGKDSPKKTGTIQVNSLPNSASNRKKEMTSKERHCSSSSGSSSESKGPAQVFTGRVARRRGRPRKKFHKKKLFPFKPTVPKSSVIDPSNASELEIVYTSPNLSASTVTLMDTASSEPHIHRTISSDISKDLKDDIVGIKESKKMWTLWSVEEVCEFVETATGSVNYADLFKSEEMDGHALSLVKLDHLMTGMSMKLGHAVKLIAEIDSLKGQLEVS